MTSAHLARAGAIAIAVVAALDPPLSRNRAVPVSVAIIHGPEDRAAASDIRRALSPDFTILDGPSPESEATVVVVRGGAPLPRLHDRLRVFTIGAWSRPASLHVRAVDVPPVTARGRIVTADITVDAIGLRGQTMTLSLYAGKSLAARATREIDRDVADVTASMTFVPVTDGPLPVHVEVAAGGVSARGAAATVTGNRALRVLFVGSRPSWGATFIRRALEQDPAFRVSSSVGTSRGVASTTDDGPGLADSNARERFDVVVAGAPSALTESAMRELDAFARVRGGTVLLLADADSARALERMTSLRGWTRRTAAEPFSAYGRHGTLRLSDALTPAYSVIRPIVLADAGSQGIVMQVPSGEGRVIVSGALDDWRYRSDSQASYEGFWTGIIADAALASAPPLSLRITPSSVRPGDPVAIEAAARGARGGDTLSIEASMKTPDGRTQMVRLWPSATPGVFTGHAIAPADAGPSTISVSTRATDDASRAEATFFVDPGSALPASMTSEAAALLASTHGGADVGHGNLLGLRAALAGAFPAHRAPATIRPMRYAWWLLPFTLLLGYEWRWRRQRGLK